MLRHEGIELTKAALSNVEESGINIWDDVEEIRAGAWTRESFLAHCLDGADEDRVQGWHDYVVALFSLPYATAGKIKTFTPRKKQNVPDPKVEELRRENLEALPSVEELGSLLREWSAAFGHPLSPSREGAWCVFLPRGYWEGMRSASHGWVLRLDSPPVGDWGYELVPSSSMLESACADWDERPAAERMLAAARKVIATW